MFKIGWISLVIWKPPVKKKKKVRVKSSAIQRKTFGLNARRPEFWPQCLGLCYFSVSAFLLVKWGVSVGPVMITYKSITQIQPLLTFLAYSDTSNLLNILSPELSQCHCKCLVHFILNDYIWFYLTDMPFFNHSLLLVIYMIYKYIFSIVVGTHN